jgi:hypothetical protein
MNIKRNHEKLGRIEPVGWLILSSETNPNRKGIAARIAIIKFDPGPAIETHMVADRERRSKT